MAVSAVGERSQTLQSLRLGLPTCCACRGGGWTFTRVDDCNVVVLRSKVVITNTLDGRKASSSCTGAFCTDEI